MASLEEPVAPTFTQQLLPSREVMEGSRVRLDCVLIGNPEPEVKFPSPTQIEQLFFSKIFLFTQIMSMMDIKILIFSKLQQK